MNTQKLLAALCFFSTAAYAGITQWPMYMGSDIKDANGERLISSYILTGTFPDGSPAVKRIDKTTVRYYETLSARRDENIYFVNELNCSTGELRAFSYGSLEQQRVLSPGKTYNINDQRTEIHAAYKEVCREAGVIPTPEDLPAANKAKRPKERSL